MPQCTNYEGKNAVITGTDIEGADNKFDNGYYSVQFEDGFTLSALSGKCLKKVADKPLKESNTKLKLKAGDTFENAGITWKVLDQNDDDTLIVALDDDGKERDDRYVIAWGLQNDGSWNQGHYFQTKDAALNKFKSRGKLTESVITEADNDDKLYGYNVTKFDKLPPFKSGLWIRITRNGKYGADYYTFVNDAMAKECYKEIVSGVVDPQDISDISLGFTASDGSEQIRWQDYADNFTPYIAPDKKSESSKITEDKELTEDPSDDLEKIGYKQIRNADGEILYKSDVLYSPEISVFGSIIDVIPLTDLPIQMTVEDHGKMVARLAQVQKVLEDLR